MPPKGSGASISARESPFSQPPRISREPPQMVESPRQSDPDTISEMLLRIVSKVTQYNEQNFPRFYATPLVLLKNSL